MWSDSERIYALIRTLEENINPVIKVPLTIYRINDQLCMDESISMNLNNVAYGLAGTGDQARGLEIEDGDTNLHFDAI